MWFIAKLSSYTLGSCKFNKESNFICVYNYIQPQLLEIKIPWPHKYEDRWLNCCTCTNKNNPLNSLLNQQERKVYEDNSCNKLYVLNLHLSYMYAPFLPVLLNSGPFIKLVPLEMMTLLFEHHQNTGTTQSEHDNKDLFLEL